MDTTAHPPGRLGETVDRVLDCLPLATVVRGVDGTVLAWNVAAETTFGWSRDQTIGRAMADLLVIPADRTAARDVVDLAEAGGAWRGEFTVLRADGRPVRIHANVTPLRSTDGDIIATVCAAEDVSDIRRVEQRASDLADHLLLALSAGDLGTWHWDILTGLTTWDATMARLFGRDLATFDGNYETWRSCLHPDDADTVVAVVEQAVADRAAYEIEHRVVHADGSVRWLLCRGMVTVDLDGEPTGTIGCGTDITERKQGELDRERRMARAEQVADAERLTRERLEFLAAITTAALSSNGHEELMQAAAAAAVPRLGDWCAIHFIGEPGSAPIVEAAHSDPERVAWLRALQARYPFDPDAPTGVAAVIRTGEPEIVQIDKEYIDEAIRATTVMPEAEARAIVDALRLTSIITVPLRTNRGVVGAIQFVSAESGRAYGDDDVALAVAAAAQLGATLDNVWLAGQYRSLADDLQEALLPVDLPTIEGLDIAVRYWAAGSLNEVGGDFYDIFPSGDGRWSVVVGDVCGTGPQAAAVTAKTRHTIRAAATHGADHIAVLEWVNDAILASHRGRFCTIVYATVEQRSPGSWTMEIVAGGHPLPVIVRADGTTHRAGRHGTLIGALSSVRLNVAETTLNTGDTIVLYTDGITDVAPPHGLDDDQLDAIVARSVVGVTSAEEACDNLRSELDTILPFERRHDDMAIIAIRIV